MSAAAIAAPNAFPPNDICHYTVARGDPPQIIRGKGTRCDGCWRKTTNYSRCNVTTEHGCIGCADIGIPCVVQNWALPPHPERTAKRAKTQSVGWSCCTSCTAHKDCDRTFPCRHCIERNHPEFCDRLSWRGVVYREIPGLEFYGFWIKLGAGRGPMGREDRDPMGHWSNWLMPDNYHIEFALYKYWQNNWLDHWRGPTPLTWGTPEIPLPQGRIYIGPPPGKTEPESLTWYRPLHAPSDPKSGYPKGHPLPDDQQNAARAEWRAVVQPAQSVPNRPCPLLRGSLYDVAPADPAADGLADAPLRAVPQGVSAPVDPAVGGYGAFGSFPVRPDDPAGILSPYPDLDALLRQPYGAADPAGGYGAAASGLGLYRPIRPADPSPVGNPFMGFGLGGGPPGLTTPDPRNNKRPGSPERERPGVKKAKPSGNGTIRDDPVYQLLSYNQDNQNDQNNENNVDVDMMEQDELHHNENNPVARAGSSPPHMYGGAEPPRRVYDLEHEGNVLELMDAAFPVDTVFSPATEKSPTPPGEMRDAAGNILSPLSALIASGPDPDRMTPWLEMLPRDVPGATGLPLPPVAPPVQPQLLAGRAPTTPEEAIVRNEALYRPHAPRMRGLWQAQTFNRDVNFRSVASQHYHDSIARALNPRGEQIRGTAAPVARPASPGPTIPLFVGARGEIPHDHPFERAGGKGAMPNIHRVRAWGEGAVTRGNSAGLCGCMQYTHGICESEEHHPGVPHYVCADCDNKSRRALKALFLEVNFINKTKRYACAECTSGFINNPACLHGSGQEIYEAAFNEDAAVYPSYDPRVMKTNLREGEGTVIRGGIYEGKRYTGCACADKLLGRRLCNPHRTQAWINCLDRMYEMAAYKYNKFEGMDLCWNCLENSPLMPGDNQDLAGHVWGCIICSGIVIGMNPAGLIVHSEQNSYPLVGDAAPGDRVRLLTPEEEAAQNNQGLNQDDMDVDMD